MWAILSEEGWWSNDQGWVHHRPDATRFTRDEKDAANLPIGDDVRWIKMI